MDKIKALPKELQKDIDSYFNNYVESIFTTSLNDFQLFINRYWYDSLIDKIAESIGPNKVSIGEYAPAINYKKLYVGLCDKYAILITTAEVFEILYNNYLTGDEKRIREVYDMLTLYFESFDYREYNRKFLQEPFNENLYQMTLRLGGDTTTIPLYTTHGIAVILKNDVPRENINALQKELFNVTINKAFSYFSLPTSTNVPPGAIKMIELNVIYLLYIFRSYGINIDLSVLDDRLSTILFKYEYGRGVQNEERKNDYFRNNVMDILGEYSNVIGMYLLQYAAINFFKYFLPNYPQMDMKIKKSVYNYMKKFRIYKYLDNIRPNENSIIIDETKTLNFTAHYFDFHRSNNIKVQARLGNIPFSFDNFEKIYKFDYIEHAIKSKALINRDTVEVRIISGKHHDDTNITKLVSVYKKYDRSDMYPDLTEQIKTEIKSLIIMTIGLFLSNNKERTTLNSKNARIKIIYKYSSVGIVKTGRAVLGDEYDDRENIQTDKQDFTGHICNGFGETESDNTDNYGWTKNTIVNAIYESKFPVSVRFKGSEGKNLAWNWDKSNLYEKLIPFIPMGDVNPRADSKVIPGFRFNTHMPSNYYITVYRMLFCTVMNIDWSEIYQKFTEGNLNPDVVFFSLKQIAKSDFNLSEQDLAVVDKDVLKLFNLINQMAITRSSIKYKLHEEFYAKRENRLEAVLGKKRRIEEIGEVETAGIIRRSLGNEQYSTRRVSAYEEIESLCKNPNNFNRGILINQCILLGIRNRLPMDLEEVDTSYICNIILRYIKIIKPT